MRLCRLYHRWHKWHKYDNGSRVIHRCRLQICNKITQINNKFANILTLLLNKQLLTVVNNECSKTFPTVQHSSHSRCQSSHSSSSSLRRETRIKRESDAKDSFNRLLPKSYYRNKHSKRLFFTRKIDQVHTIYRHFF